MSVVNRSTVGGVVAVIELDDQPRYNALSVAMVSDLRAAFAEIAEDHTIRAVVLTGAGRGFCAGANMTGEDGTLAAAQGRGRMALVQTMQEHLAKLMLQVRELPQPVIGAIHGAAVGGGLALALACDLRVAADDAFFASHFIKVGLSSCDVGTSYLLPRLVGPTMAAELMLTGRRFSADEAHRIGLLNRVVTRDELLPTAHDLARQIADNSEYGVYMTKIGLWANLDAPSLRHAMELENRTQVLGTYTGNMSEAQQAFVEKRPPVWNPM